MQPNGDDLPIRTQPRAAHRRPSERSQVRAAALIAVKIVAAVLSTFVAVASFWVWSTWRQFNSDIAVGAALPSIVTAAPSAGATATATPTRDVDGPAQNILLLGNDSRAGATAAELRALGTGEDGGSANTDTMMILHIPAGGAKATVISFPRDSYVAIPGHGMAKLNAAYPDGYVAASDHGANEVAAESAGILLLSQTLGQLTGLHIDHYIQINLLGFYRVSNAIGGVPVVLCGAQKEPKSGIDLPAGRTVISGTQALAFVRQRYDLPGGDLDRIKRQQYFLESTFHKLTASGTLLNPYQVRRLLGAVSSSLLVDPGLKIEDLAGEFADLSEGNLSFETIPTNGNATNDAGAVILVDPVAVRHFAQVLVKAAGAPTKTNTSRPSGSGTATATAGTKAGIGTGVAHVANQRGCID
jgi:LCP family protein required for cell wall assembly